MGKDKKKIIIRNNFDKFRLAGDDEPIEPFSFAIDYWKNSGQEVCDSFVIVIVWIDESAEKINNQYPQYEIDMFHGLLFESSARPVDCFLDSSIDFTNDDDGLQSYRLDEDFFKECDQSCSTLPEDKHFKVTFERKSIFK